MNALSPHVLICGGGMSGVVAAVAAARAGADTLLVERWGYLGGSATAAAVGQFVGWETEAGRQVVRGSQRRSWRGLSRGAAPRDTNTSSCRPVIAWIMPSTTPRS